RLYRLTFPDHASDCSSVIIGSCCEECCIIGKGHGGHHPCEKQREKRAHHPPVTLAAASGAAFASGKGTGGETGAPAPGGGHEKSSARPLTAGSAAPLTIIRWPGVSLSFSASAFGPPASMSLAPGNGSEREITGP